MKREQIEKVIEAMSVTGKVIGELTHLRDEGLFTLSETELEERVTVLVDKSDGVLYTLADLLNEYTGVSNNDFIGDGYFQMMLDLFYNEKHTPQEILEEFEKVDVVAQREWVVEYNLRLLDEYNEKIKNGIDVERSRQIFDARFKLLLEQTEVPISQKLKYGNLLLDYVNGKKSKEDMISKYEFYILK